MSASSTRLTSFCLSIGARLALSGAPALAQDNQGELLDPTEAQYQLNEQALQAHSRKRYKEAVALYKRALKLGELNITYLNLARSYQRLGECVEAELTFRKALSAPAVKDPPPDKVRDYVRRFRAEEKRCATRS